MPRDFLNETSTIDKHSPFGDYSAFRAVLNPSGGYLNIQLKVKYAFRTGWRLLHPTMTEGKFKKKLADMVDNVWSGRYGIVIQGNTDNRKVTVLPSVTVVEAGNDAHFTIDVQRLGSGRSYVTDGRCRFYAGAINYKPSALAMKIGYKITFGEWSHDRTIYKDAESYAKRMLEREIKYNANSVAPINPGRAQMMAGAMKDMADVWPLLPLKLTGYRLATEPASLGLQRASGFLQALKQAGAPNSPIQVTDGGIGSAPLVKVEVVNAQSEFLRRANNFPIAAHEVGHMLGLCDEYEDPSDAAQINAFAQNRQITIPKFSSNTSSLMSQGDKLLPYHYVPFLQTIETMAANFRRNHADGINGTPTIAVQDNLLRSANPDVLTKVEIADLFAEDPSNG